MEIVVKKETILDLVPLVLPFDYRFSFNKSSKGDETWFTSNDVAIHKEPDKNKSRKLDR